MKPASESYSLPAMLPSTSTQPDQASAIRIGVVSPDDAYVEGLTATFAVRRLMLRTAMREPELMDIDVLVIDARHRSHLMQVARLVAEGTFGVVVLARPQDSLEAMKYLDVGALDVIWAGTPDVAAQARIRAAARHARPVDAEWKTFGDIAISPTRREVRRFGDVVRLTPTEFRLVEALVAAGGHTLSHRDLIIKVWGSDVDANRHQLRVYIRQLREKLERDASAPDILLTEPGVGYRLVEGVRRAWAV